MPDESKPPGEFVSQSHCSIQRKTLLNSLFITSLVRYDSEKSFIGTDFASAMNAATDKQLEYLRHMQQQQKMYPPHNQSVPLQYNMQNSQGTYDNYTSNDNRSSSHEYYKVNNFILCYYRLSVMQSQLFTYWLSFFSSKQEN